MNFKKNTAALVLLAVLGAAAIHGEPAETCPKGFCPGSVVKIIIGSTPNVPRMFDGKEGTIQIFHANLCDVTVRFNENDNPITVRLPTKVLYANL